MKKIPAGKFDGGTLFFVPGNKEINGIVSAGKQETPVDFWRFVEKRPDIEPIIDNKIQKELWSMDIQDTNWVKKYYPALMNAIDDTYNPYNEKAVFALKSIDSVRTMLFKNNARF